MVRITRAAIGLAVVSAAMGIAPIAGLLAEDGDETLYFEILGVVLVGVADRLERLGAGPQVQAECERLRRLARSAAR